MDGFESYPNEPPSIRALLEQRGVFRDDIARMNTKVVWHRDQVASLDERIKQLTSDVQEIEEAVADLRRSKVAHDNVLNSVLNGYVP